MTYKWKECKVGNYVSFQNGYAFKSKDFSDIGEYRIVKIKELKDGFVKFFSDTARVDIQNISEFEKYIIKKRRYTFCINW